MADDRVGRLFDEAATAGLRITGLDGWTQTRLAGSLRLRREVVNAIINKDPVAEPSESRPRMVEACRRIIAFAAVISQKGDAVVPREVDSACRLDDDARAYECHKLRLRSVVEDAVAGGAFIEAMYRVGELSSHAVNAPPRFRVKMIGNVVTAVQRLLDKPQSRSIPVDLLDYNLRRLTLAEWAARRAVRAIAAPSQERAGADDDLAYIRGQVGYAMIFNGLLARSPRAIRRGRRRLWRAVALQPAPDSGHWSNLLRAINDLLASGHTQAEEWALAAVSLAEKQRNPGFALAYTRLRGNRELATLIGFWESRGVVNRVGAVLGRTEGTGAQNASPQSTGTRRKRARGATAAAVLMVVCMLLNSSARAGAGDGRELATRNSSPQRTSQTPSQSRATADGSGGSAFPAAPRGRGSDSTSPFRGASSARAGSYATREGVPSRGPVGHSLNHEREDSLAVTRTTRRSPTVVAAAPRFERRGLYDEVDGDRELSTDRSPGEDEELHAAKEPPSDDADLSPAPKRVTRRPASSKPRNRVFPLIVVRDLPKSSTRTTPRATAPKAAAKVAKAAPTVTDAPGPESRADADPLR